MKSIKWAITLEGDDGNVFTFTGDAMGVENQADFDGYASDILLTGAAIGISKPVRVGE